MKDLCLHFSIRNKVSSNGKKFYTLYLEELKKEFFIDEQDIYILSLLFGNNSNEEKITD